MNLPRRALAEIAAGRPLLRELIETGGHPGKSRPPRCAAKAMRPQSTASPTRSGDITAPKRRARVRIIARTPAEPGHPIRDLGRDAAGDRRNPARCASHAWP